MKEDFCPEAAKAWEPFLEKQALTEIEFWLLDEIYMTVAMPIERLIDWTLNVNQEPVAKPRADVELALRSLLDRGLLLEIDEQSMSAIHLLLDRSQLVPACGWPKVGSVDLSLRGAAVMTRWRELLFGSLDGSAARTMQDGSSEIVLGKDRKAVADFIDVCLKTEEDFVEAGEITPCGPWCIRW
jgi:hypothetical protein